jgi:hypothetical protein
MPIDIEAEVFFLSMAARVLMGFGKWLRLGFGQEQRYTNWGRGCWGLRYLPGNGAGEAERPMRGLLPLSSGGAPEPDSDNRRTTQLRIRYGRQSKARNSGWETTEGRVQTQLWGSFHAGS